MAKQIKEFDLVENQKIEIVGCHSVFLAGADPILACFKFEAKVDVIGDIF